MKKVVAVLCHGKPNRQSTALNQEGDRQIQLFAQKIPEALKAFSPGSNIVEVHATLNCISIESMLKFVGYMGDESVNVHHESLHKQSHPDQIWALAHGLLSYDDGVHVIFAEPRVTRLLLRYLEETLGRRTDVRKRTMVPYGSGFLIYQTNTVFLC